MALIFTLIYLWLYLIPLSLTIQLCRLSPSSHYLLICPSSRHCHSCFLPVIQYEVSGMCTEAFVCDLQQTCVSFTVPQLKLSVCMCWLLCRRVSPERGQSSWLAIRSVCQQPRALPLLPLSTQLPPPNPQGEPRPEGAWGWPSHGKCTWSLCDRKVNQGGAVCLAFTVFYSVMLISGDNL